ncbi:uncharacterized protein LACBIDRAFT_304097 [Laccaria bicolor S238N-H82]|uniref:Predicted protein n=1 Tax=Laccaria bicolor (strain S238N-H82 / ATCC MYA-4686) TaxID=486041 RepID=B0DKY2_LACBS|nr:uncharacterized protein LACBIDRAFT_304097 [Laccaria bicolor S238N-H82]EDR04818.1 predicted protein [Laccaria bicolor S238N-H82]|eukprot:XP_001884642.1 predicted protein [Laccaria bicolor S238N-H82]
MAIDSCPLNFRRRSAEVALNHYDRNVAPFPSKICRIRAGSRRRSGATHNSRDRPVDPTRIRSRWHCCWVCGCLDPIHILRRLHLRRILHLYVYRRNRNRSCRWGHFSLSCLHGHGSVALAFLRWGKGRLAEIVL